MSFKKLDGDTAIIQSRGVFKQADLYEWNGKLFVAASGGFIRLKENGSTSKDGIGFVELQIERELFRDRHGRLCVAAGTDRQALGSNSPALALASD